MPSFMFRVIDAQDEVVAGTLKATSLPVAQQRLQTVYKAVLFVAPVEEAKDVIAHRRTPRVKLDSLAIYCRQLSVMVKAGIAVNRAFRFCGGGEDHNLNVVMQRVANDIESGKSISQALGEQPRAFNGLFVGLVKAGETSGTLDNTLRKLSDLLEKSVAMQKRVQSALAYPAVIMVVCIAVTAFFTYYIIPSMLPIFTSLGVELPLATKLLLAFAAAAQNPLIVGPLFISGAALIFGAFAIYQQAERFPRLRFSLDEHLMKIPVLGRLMTLAAQSKILFTLATLLDAGVSLAESLSTVEYVAGNQVLASRVKWSREALINGASISQSFTKYDLFEPMALQMIKVGEETGQLAEMIARVGSLYEDDVEQQLDSLAALIEPLIMGVMGLVVGFITLSSFLPMVQLLNNL